MKIYKLIVNEIADDPLGGMISSFKAERKPKTEQFFLHEEMAESRRKEIWDGIIKLAGFIPKLDIEIQIIEVIE